MRKLVALAAVVSCLGSSAITGARAQDREKENVCTIKVKGMACGACAAKVEETALKLEGVKAAKVNQKKGTADVTYDPKKTEPAAIAKYITARSGFKTEYDPPKASPKR